MKLSRDPTVIEATAVHPSLGREQIDRAIDAAVLRPCDGKQKNCPQPGHANYEEGELVADVHFAKGKAWGDFEAAAHE